MSGSISATTLAYMATAAAVGTAAVGIGSSISSADAASEQAKSQQNAFNYNATVANQNSENALAAASANEDAQRRASAVKMGSQVASLTENGVSVTSGSGADLVEQSDINSEMDALNIRYQGKLQSKAYKDQSALEMQQAAAAGNRASNASTAGYLGAGSSVLSSAGAYAKYKLPSRTTGLT